MKMDVRRRAWPSTGALAEPEPPSTAGLGTMPGKEVTVTRTRGNCTTPVGAADAVIASPDSAWEAASRRTALCAELSTVRQLALPELVEEVLELLLEDVEEQRELDNEELEAGERLRRPPVVRRVPPSSGGPLMRVACGGSSSMWQLQRMAATKWLQVATVAATKWQPHVAAPCGSYKETISFLFQTLPSFRY